MRIKITPKFTAADLKKDIIRRAHLIHEGFLQELEMIGEEFVKNARENGNYKDHTGNLRNSIGYIIFDNGRQVRENIRQSVVPHVETVKKKTRGHGKRYATEATDKKALAIARMMARKVARTHGMKGLLLVCVAGMDYAAAVESRGKDVISASSIIAQNDLKEAMASWRKQAK